MISVNNGDLGLPDLAGLSVPFTDPIKHELQQELYVYGLRDNDKYDIFIDPKMHCAGHIYTYLNRYEALKLCIGIRGAPKKRPALGITRTFREQEYIEASTKVAVFVLLALNNKIEFECPSWEVKIGDLVSLENKTGVVVDIIDDTACVLTKNVETIKLNRLVPKKPTKAYDLCRPRYDNLFYGTEEFDPGYHSTFKFIGQMNNSCKVVCLDGNYAGHEYYVDMDALVAVQ